MQKVGEGVRPASSGGLKILLVNHVAGGSLTIARYCACDLLKRVFKQSLLARECMTT
jgi:hypothetical protein